MCARACVCVSSCVSAGAPGRSQLNCARAFIYLCMVCCLPLQNVLELSHANADFVCMHLQNVLELGTYVAYTCRMYWSWGHTLRTLAYTCRMYWSWGHANADFVCIHLQNVLGLSHANADFVCMHLQNVLELGTYVAYSAIRIMTVAPDTARLFTVETSVSETFGLWYLALLCVHYCSVLECVLLLQCVRVCVHYSSVLECVLLLQCVRVCVATAVC